MASGSKGVQKPLQQQQQQQQQQQFKCKDCGLALNSADSLEVHERYHADNLMQKWAAKAQNSNSEEKNNNMTKMSGGTMKREFVNNTDGNSDIHKTTPEYQRTSPGVYGHPPTPQSYQSGSSPYQNQDNSTISPNFHSQNYQMVKSGGTSPAQPNQYQQQQQGSFAYAEQFYSSEIANNYQQENHINAINSHIQGSSSSSSAYRYNPYRPSQQQQQQQYYPEAQKPTLPAISPSYPPQPTPSPSPKQCDKCGYICHTANQLIEHNNTAHSVGQAPQYNQRTNQHFIFDHPPIKEEDTSQSEILDLDSQKVVHPDWSDGGKPGDKRLGDEPGHPHSVSTILTWPPQPHQDLYPSDQTLFLNNDQKLFNHSQIIPPSHSMEQNFMNNSVSSSNPDLGQQQQPQQYRAFDHLPAAAVSNSVISSTQQVHQVPNTTSAAPSGTKSANWKSNEARRPKTYNCTACNKWFTSSGHLKRHYNTTLHKNAVKSSGHPDPATMPISAHHHPTRDSAHSKDDRQNSTSPREDSRDDSNSMGAAQYDNRMNGLLQPMGQALHHSQLSHLGTPMMQNSSGFVGLAAGSPPNGEAGLSTTTTTDTRGLLPSISTHNFNMMPQPHVMSMEPTHQYHQYPNGSAPHVTQATDITTNSLNSTGEQIQQFVVSTEHQPLPSFAHVYGGGYASVGGLGLATAPATLNFYTNETFDINIIQPTDQQQQQQQQQIITNMHQINQFSPNTMNNNNEVSFMEIGTTTTYVEQAPATVTTEETLNVSTESVQEESKENFEEGTSQENASVSSTVPPNQEDLSKTKCFDCDKVFNRPCYLTQHNKTCHNGDKPFKCSRCGKRFPTEETFTEHTNKHAGDKPHKCDSCPKMFNHKTDLRRHLCCHTGRKPYACEICGKGFIRKDHMVKHMDTHLRKKEKLSAMRN